MAARSTVQLIVLGCLTAIAAAAFTFMVFGIQTPPRDLATLLTPPVTPPSPAPTKIRPTPTVLPATPRLFFSDNFNKTGNWPHAATDISSGYADRGYFIAPTWPSQFTRVFLNGFADTESRDVSIQADAAPYSTSSPIGYGVFFWHDANKEGQERFLYFGVTSEGMYTLRASVPVSVTTATPEGTMWVELVASTPSKSIKLDGEPNRLRVDVHPHRIIAFVNGTPVIDRTSTDVDDFRNRQDFDGRVGILAYPIGRPNARVLFSLFQVYADIKG